MNREDYLAQLKLTLEENDFGPVEEAIAYFDEMLKDRMDEEGMDEEAAVASMDAPEQIASQLAQPKQAAPRQSQEEPFVPGVRTIHARPGQVRAIVVRDRNTRLILRGWDQDDIQIRHPETEKIRYDFTLEDGRLSLIRQPGELSIRLFQFENLSQEMREVTLDVPRELAAELDLRTSNGRLSAEGLACWGVVSLKTSNGSLLLKDFRAKAIQAGSSNGSLTLDQVKADKTLTAVTSNGKIHAAQVTAPELLSLKTSNGSINVDGLDSQAIELASSNGAIRGMLPGAMGDYTIRSATSNGKSSLPKQQDGGAKALSVHTSNARIDLGFMQGGTSGGDTAQTNSQHRHHGGSAEEFSQDADRFSESVAKSVEEGMERFGNAMDRGMEGFGNAMDKGLESIGDLSERITRAVEDALARAFDKRKQNGEDDGAQG